MNERQRFKFNIFFLAVLFIWPVLKTFYIDIDGAARVESLVTVFAILVNGRYLFRGPFTMKIWIIWVVYSFINLYFHGYHHDFPFVWWSFSHLIRPLVSMLVVYNMVIYNRGEFIKKTFYFFIFFVFVGAANLAQATTQRFVNDMGNSFLNNAIFIMPFLSLFIRNKKSVIIYYFIIAFLFLIILYSGERKALAGLFIMIMGLFFARNSKQNITSIFVMLAVLIIAYFGTTFVMENTVVGNRFNDQFANTDYNDNLFLTLMGDRAYMYVDGFAIFIQHPWTGIGLTNFISHSLNIRGFTLHTEYMVELAECGIIGSSLFLIFYIGMIIRLVKMYKKKSALYETIILATALLAIIEINFSAWTYGYSYYFMVFGLLYAYSDIVLKNSIKQLWKL